MNLDNLPNELLKHIISYMNDLDDAKNFSLTSKRMHSLALERLWSKPRYYTMERSLYSSLYFLHFVSRFPVKELQAKDFECPWPEITKMMPKLKLLHLDNCSYYARIPEESQLAYLAVPVVLYLSAFKLKEEKHIQQLFEIIESITVKEMVINYDSDNFRLALEDLKMFMNKVPITELHLDCLQISSVLLVECGRSYPHFGNDEKLSNYLT